MQTEPLACAPIVVLLITWRCQNYSTPSFASTQWIARIRAVVKQTLFLLRSEVDGFLLFRSISPIANLADADV
jgi:hypothetical protein